VEFGGSNRHIPDQLPAFSSSHEAQTYALQEVGPGEGGAIKHHAAAVTRVGLLRVAIVDKMGIGRDKSMEEGFTFPTPEQGGVFGPQVGSVVNGFYLVDMHGEQVETPHRLFDLERALSDARDYGPDGKLIFVVAATAATTYYVSYFENEGFRSQEDPVVIRAIDLGPSPQRTLAAASELQA
jgi:hypothetical protein